MNQLAVTRMSEGRKLRVMPVVGWLLLGLAGAALAYELLLAVQTGGYRTIAAGELWFRLHGASLNVTQAVIQRYVHPLLWDPVLQTVLLWPAWAVFGVPGGVLLLLWRWRRARSA